MREIKFRAWIKVSQKIASWEMIKEKKNLHRLIENPEYLLMQYTGLKDKNGVEIYEGDIVNVEGLGYGIIEYFESYFRIFKPYVFSANLCNYTSSIELESKNKVEVIGNIYENQDLLSEAK